MSLPTPTSRPAIPLPRQVTAATTRAASQPQRRGLSPLTLRILAINFIALLVLVAGVLYLGRYQDQLFQAELDSLALQARIFAGAIAEGAIPPSADEFNEPSTEIEGVLARQMVRRLVETTDTRTRLYGTDGRLIADSRVIGGPKSRVQIEELAPPPDGNRLTQLGLEIYDLLINTMPGREKLPLYPETGSDLAKQYPDVIAALDGAVTTKVWRIARPDGRNDLLLTAAVPVQRVKKVLGAVFVSRSGKSVDDAVRQVRLEILRFFTAAAAVTLLLSLYLAGTIVRPIRRLAAAADAVRHGHGREVVIPDFTRRQDEIGELSSALRQMTDSIWTRMDAIERFAADVAHEIKNPLTSLRSAVETVQRVTDESQRQRLLAIIKDDVQRLDRLISDISNASRIDAELSRAEVAPVDLGNLLRMFEELYQATGAAAAEGGALAEPGSGGAGTVALGLPPRVAVELPAGANLMVRGLEGRLTQVFQNLIANALSFSPPGGVVRLSAKPMPGQVEVTCEDDGPGIPEGKLAAIFDRFYTERPAAEKFGTHSGLGLSISKQIIEAHGGRIHAANRKNKDGTVVGAVFTVLLPR
jgi:two-component system sensor histidine kinase ChvG